MFIVSTKLQSTQTEKKEAKQKGISETELTMVKYYSFFRLKKYEFLPPPQFTCKMSKNITSLSMSGVLQHFNININNSSNNSGLESLMSATKVVYMHSNILHNP
jgi:hypothetical protein